MANTQPRWQIEKHLTSYLALVEYWDAGAGDTHELLGVREILHTRYSELAAEDVLKMKSADDRVLALNVANRWKSGWDVKMLGETAALIERGFIQGRVVGTFVPAPVSKADQANNDEFGGFLTLHQAKHEVNGVFVEPTDDADDDGFTNRMTGV